MFRRLLCAAAVAAHLTLDLTTVAACSRQRYREADKLVEEICHKHGVARDQRSFLQANWDVVKHLRQCSIDGIWGVKLNAAE